MSSDVTMLYATLQATMDPDLRRRKPAEESLTRWETLPSFCTMLHEIFSNKNANDSVRLLAALHFKNTAERHWQLRHNDPGIHENEKAQLRTKLLQIFDEDPKISIQIALSIAFIARLDFPQLWPDLMTNLIQVIQSGNSLEKQRASLNLHHVVKALGSKRLPSNRLEFEQVSQKLFPFVSNLWLSSIDTFLASLASFSKKEATPEQLTGVIPVAEICRFCIKILRGLLVLGLPNFHQFPDTVHFLNCMKERLGALIYYRDTVLSNPLWDHILKLITLKGKLALTLQKTHPLPFVVCLPGFLEFFSQQILKNSERSEDRFTIQCMLFLKNSIEADAYDTPPKHDQSQIQLYEQGNKIVSSFLNPGNNLALSLCAVLVKSHFLLTPLDLEEWESDPEDYFTEAEIDSWQERKKPCAERLLLTLLEKHKQWLAPQIIQMLQQFLSESSKSAELLKDACYMTLGVGQFHFHELIPFDSFLTDILGQINNVDPRNKIIRRRLIWLIGCWVPKIPKVPEVRKNLFRSLLPHLVEPDVVICLTTANTFEQLVHDFDFNVDDFLEFLDSAIHLLFQLLERVKECNSKLTVLNIIAAFIKQFDEKIYPYVIPIIDRLKGIWQIAQPHESYNLLKQATLNVASEIVGILSEGQPNQIEAFYQFAIPIIRHGTTLSNVDSLYLLEDGLRLWRSILFASPALNPLLLSIYPNITAILAANLENIQICMKIIEQYLLKGRSDFLKSYVVDLVSTFDNIIGNVKDSPTLWTLSPIEIFVTLFPNEAPQYLDRLLQKMLSTVLNEKVSSLVGVHFIAIFSRILLQNPNFFFGFFQRMSQSLGPRILINYIDVWFERCDDMAQPSLKKLSALAMCNLLVVKNDEILSYLAQIISFCTTAANSTPIDSDESFDDLIVDSKPVSASQSLLKSDPVFQLDVRAYFMQKMNESATVNGPNFQAAIQRVDPTILTSFQQSSNRTQ